MLTPIAPLQLAVSYQLVKSREEDAVKFIPKLLAFLVLVASLATPISVPVSAQDTADTPDVVADTAAIRATLDALYDAMYKVDGAGIMATVTPQFLLLEGILPLSAAELIARLQKGGTDTKWGAEFSDFRTRFMGDVAWTTVKNHEIAQGTDGKVCKADFLETIVFVRDGEHWLIDRYHAAVENDWACED